MTASASAVVSSAGSRTPDDERQWTHARLQAYVTSHVRQIGASRPRLSRSMCRNGADDIGLLECGQRVAERALAGPVDAATSQCRLQCAGVGVQLDEDLDEVRGVDEEEATGVVVINQRPEA